MILHNRSPRISDLLLCIIYIKTLMDKLMTLFKRFLSHVSRNSFKILFLYYIYLHLDFLRSHGSSITYFYLSSSPKTIYPTSPRKFDISPKTLKWDFTSSFRHFTKSIPWLSLFKYKILNKPTSPSYLTSPVLTFISSLLRKPSFRNYNLR